MVQPVRQLAGRAPEQDRARGRSMIGWAGGLIAFYGAAHTVGAFVAEGAARHVGSWWRGDVRAADLSTMNPATSAYWLSVNSFGPPLIVLGATVLRLGRRGVAPPGFIAYALAAWAVVDTILAGPGVGQNLILLIACALLLGGARRA